MQEKITKDKDRLTEVVSVRVTEETGKGIRRKARESGLKRPEWLRAVLDREAGEDNDG